MPFEFRSKARWLTAIVICGALTGCATTQKNPAPGQADADKFLFDRGTEFLAKKNWLTAREYFRRIVDSYPQSTFRADAKLGVGDSYLGENRIDSLILAANEYREFLTFFPLNPRADYAQYKLAIAQSRQMLRPERDQTATHEALKELQKFIDNFPNSPYRAEVDKLHRAARDRLSESEFLVGRTYYRQRWMQGALNRFSSVLRDDPGYTRKDAVYFYSAEALRRLNLFPEAVPQYERLLTEFPKSKFAKDARKRLVELKAKASEVKR